jgi:hypothetical protein
MAVLQALAHWIAFLGGTHFFANQKMRWDGLVTDGHWQREIIDNETWEFAHGKIIA